MGFLDATGITTLVNKLKTKFQPLLVSGTNIKMVGGYSLLGSGNVPFPTVPIASNKAPLMDGTASSGSGTTYARGNHRHPTDTSRQETLVSGTNIKTINGNSLLGSGDLTVGGGGGGGLLVTVETDQVPPRLSATFREIYNVVSSGNGIVIKKGGRFYTGECWVNSTTDGFEYNDVTLSFLATEYPNSFRATTFDDYPTYRTSGGDI